MQKYRDKLRKPSEKQVEYARSLGIDPMGKSFRFLSAEIDDVLEMKAYQYIDEQNLNPGDKVKYIGPREDIPKELIISTIGKNGFIYFKGIKKYCRPWYVERVN